MPTPTTDHGYSGEMKKVTVLRQVRYIHPDQQSETYPPGTYEVPAEVAKQDHFRFYTDDPPPPAPVPGTSAYNERLRQEQLLLQARQTELQKQHAAERAAAMGLTTGDQTALKERIRDEVRAEFQATLDNQIRPALEAKIRAELEATLRPEIEAQVRAELADQGADAASSGKKGK